jgi:hypothetical protein
MVASTLARRVRAVGFLNIIIRIDGDLGRENEPCRWGAAVWRHAGASPGFELHPSRDCPRPIELQHPLPGPLEPTNRPCAIPKIPGAGTC